MLFKSVVSLGVLVASVAAQTNYTKLDDGGASVDDRLKASWCIGQRFACDTLCNKNAATNDCKSTDLTWNCVCGNGESPEDLADYIDTIPYHICQASYGKCIDAHPDDALGQTNCNDNIRDRCGQKNITDYSGGADTTTTDSTAASTTAAEVTATTTAGGAGGAATTSAAAATTTAANSGASALQGSVVLVAGILAAFGYML